MTTAAIPADHLRVIVDGLPIFEQHRLLLAGGYALRANGVIDRPSQDLDFATATARPLSEVAGDVAAAYRARGYRVNVIDAAPRSARLLLALPESRQELVLDLLKEALGPATLTLGLPGGLTVPVLPLPDAVGMKVRAWHDRFIVRDIIDLHAAAGAGGYSCVELEKLGQRHAPDLDLGTLLDHLGGVPVFGEDDFSAYGLSTAQIREVRAFATRWCDDLAQRLHRQSVDGQPIEDNCCRWSLVARPAGFAAVPGRTATAAARTGSPPRPPRRSPPARPDPEPGA